MKKIYTYLISAITVYLFSVYPTFSKAIEKESFGEMKTKVLEIVNIHRKVIELGELQFNETIYVEALRHSKNTADGVVPFRHDGFRDDRLMVKVGGNAIAENILENWSESADYKQSIEGNYNLAGIGIARSKGDKLYFTQIFFLKKSFKK